jgi:SAM-dependent methyltransferase
MAEINLVDRYPTSKRPIDARGRMKLNNGARIERANFDSRDVIFEQKLLSAVRSFGWEYFDGDRLYGYGGYNYDPKYWQGTVKRLYDHYQLNNQSKILDVGCAKGFLLYDFVTLHPGITVKGLDISEYAISNAKNGIKDHLCIGNASSLPFPDNSFDLVVSINTVHSLEREACIKAIKEIQRVSKKNAFIVVNAWRNDLEKEKLLKWNIAAQTYMHVDEWKQLFQDIGYTGDYYWFFP